MCKHRYCTVFTLQYRLLGRTLIPHKSLCSKSHTLKKGGGTLEKKNARIEVRCYKKEKEELREKAKQANMNMSEYIIALSENKKIIVAQGLPQLSLELKRIGVNINQIAMVANTQRFVNEYQLEKILKEMQNINKIMNLVWKKILKEE
jgi:hypothetical protein